MRQRLALWIGGSTVRTRTPPELGRTGKGKRDESA